MGRPRKPRESVIGRLFDHHPCRLQQRIGDQADHRRGGDQKRVVHFPAEQDRERSHADQRRQPVANGDAAEQDAGAEDGSDRGRIGAADKALDIRVRSVPREFDLLALPPLGADAVAIANDQHPDCQLGINRGPSKLSK